MLVYEEIERLAHKGSTPKLYEKMRRLAVDFKTGASTSITKRGDLATDVQSVLGVYRENFFSLLYGGGSSRDTDFPIDDDGTDILLSNYEYARIAIVRLKNSGDELTSSQNISVESILTIGTSQVCCVRD